MSYFECNLAHTAPHIRWAGQREKYEQTAAKLYHRTKILNSALEKSGLLPDTFADLAGVLFQRDPEHFDTYTDDQISDFTKILYNGKEYPKREEWPNATVLFDTRFATVKEWESLRHIGIGGSDCATVFCVNDYATKRTLYHDKIGTPKEEEGISPVVLDRGHFLEDRVVEIFCKNTLAERIPEFRMFASKRSPNSTANIDAILRMPDGKLAVLECKTCMAIARDKWSYDKIPANYLMQTRQYPAVLNDDRIKGTYIACIFVVDYAMQDVFYGATFEDGQMIAHFIEREPHTEAEMMKAEDYFWKNFIAAGVEPNIERRMDKHYPTKLIDEVLLDKITAAIRFDESTRVKEKAVIEETTEEDVVDYPLSVWGPTIDAYEQAQKDYEMKKRLAEDAETNLKMWKLKLKEGLGEKLLGRAELADGRFWEIKVSTNKPVMAISSEDMEAMKRFYPEVYNMYVKPRTPIQKFTIGLKKPAKTRKRAVAI